jgi:hypothetical protein
MTIALAAILRPFLYLIVWGLIATPLSRFCYRFIPAGKVRAMLYQKR